MTKLERIVAHCKASVHVTANEHMLNSDTVEEYIDRLNWDDEEINPEDTARFIKAGCIWEVQAYPRTPIGSYVAYGETLDEALDQIIHTLRISEPCVPSDGRLERIVGHVKSDTRMNVNEHTTGYGSIFEYLSSEKMPCYPKDVPRNLIDKCVASGNVWELWSGDYRVIAPNMDEAISKMLGCLELHS